MTVPTILCSKKIKNALKYKIQIPHRQRLLVAKLHEFRLVRLSLVLSHAQGIQQAKHEALEQNIAELKVALQTIRDNLSDETIRKSVQSFRKRLATCVNAQVWITASK